MIRRPPRSTLFPYPPLSRPQESPAPTSTLPANNVQQPTTPAPPVLRLTLEDALARARKNSPQFLARARASSRVRRRDRKSTRLNSSHSQISYAVFCLKNKKE